MGWYAYFVTQKSLFSDSFIHRASLVDRFFIAHLHKQSTSTTESPERALIQVHRPSRPSRRVVVSERSLPRHPPPLFLLSTSSPLFLYLSTSLFFITVYCDSLVIRIYYTCTGIPRNAPAVRQATDQLTSKRARWSEKEPLPGFCIKSGHDPWTVGCAFP